MRRRQALKIEKRVNSLPPGTHQSQVYRQSTRWEAIKKVFIPRARYLGVLRDYCWECGEHYPSYCLFYLNLLYK